MEVHPEVYKWLGALGCVDDRAHPQMNARGLVVMDDNSSYAFENGSVRPRARVSSSRPARD
jgi:hypothetical protein|eukprot:30854-Pelagococcus_subviridis.AAC.3